MMCGGMMLWHLVVGALLLAVLVLALLALVKYLRSPRRE